MVCTQCSSGTQVTNSRLQRRANSVWRRRKCRRCGLVFSTVERIDYERTWQVEDKTGERRPFLRDKLFISIFKSVQHRPAALSDALGLTATVIGKLTKVIQAEPSSDTQAPDKGSRPGTRGRLAASAGREPGGVLSDAVIATLAHDTLLRFDKAAATMYAAYHSDTL